MDKKFQDAAQTPKFQELFRLAKKARENAHCPYSQFSVGAAVITGTGQMYSGANVENAVMTSICAERSAICRAITEEGSKTKILEVFVLTQNSPGSAPCGFCRQVIAEFATDATLVHVCDPQGKFQTFSFFSELLPHAFTPDQLEKK